MGDVRGCVLVVVVLYWAQTVVVPIALAILLTFVLTPPVTWLERWIGRIPAVLAMVTLVFTVLGLAGWGLARQMDHLAEDLPRYRVNILAKIADVRGAGKVEDTLSRQETARCVARPANPGGAVGTAGAGGRQHASAAGYRGESRGLDAAGDPDVPGRARGDPAASRS